MPTINTADAVRLGASAADRVYLGVNLVWSPAAGDALLLESGDALLLESGDALLLEG